VCVCDRERERHVGSFNRLLYQHDGTRPASQKLNPIETLHLSVHVLQRDEAYGETHGRRAYQLKDLK